MSDLDDFARQCERASKGLRRIPKDLRRTLSSDVKTEVAVPLAARISSAATGPWASALSSQTKARAGADPTIVVGGAKRVLSHGGSARNVVFGTEFGGSGSRRSLVTSKKGKLFKRVSTAQFKNNRRPFVFPTISRNGDWVLDKSADLVDKVLGKEDF